MKQIGRFILIGLAGSLGSCMFTSPPPPQTQPAAQPATMASAPPPRADPEKDALPAQQYLIQLIAYHIKLPLGTVSRGEEFWKHINEQVVDVATYDLLFKNGVRVGVAPAKEWDYLKNILDNNPAVTQPSAFTGQEAKDVDLELKKGVEYQNIFYWDGMGELIGRTYERCDNVLRVSFLPAPRKPGTVRLTLCPVIKSLREKLVAVGDVNTRSIKRVYPEQMFDLNMTVDIPLDSLLVVAPSSEARAPTRLGSTFLIHDAAAQQIESLLVFKPIVYRQKIDREHPVGYEKKN